MKRDIEARSETGLTALSRTAIAAGVCPGAVPRSRLTHASLRGALVVFAAAVCASSVGAAPAAPPRATGSAAVDEVASRPARGGADAVRVTDAYVAAAYSLDEGHRRYRRHFGLHVSPFFWSGYWGWGWPYYGGSWWVEAPYAGGPWSAVDLNIKPKSAEVFVDGEYVGRVDQLDGFPRYLWVESGSRKLVVYKQGYESIARILELRAGEKLDLRLEMVPGEAKTPEELMAQLEPTTTERAEAPRRRATERREEPRAEPREEAWRRAAPAREPVAEAAVAEDQRAEPGRLVLEVTPADAVVYLDGRLLGSGEELSRLHHGLIVDPGSHTLEVVRPGYETLVRSVEVGAGEDLRLVLEPRTRSGR